jgi:hypothetical protein
VRSEYDADFVNPGDADGEFHVFPDWTWWTICNVVTDHLHGHRNGLEAAVEDDPHLRCACASSVCSGGDWLHNRQNKRTQGLDGRDDQSVSRPGA